MPEPLASRVFGAVAEGAVRMALVGLLALAIGRGLYELARPPRRRS